MQILQEQISVHAVVEAPTFGIGVPLGGLSRDLLLPSFKHLS